MEEGKALGREVPHSRLTSPAALADTLCSQVQTPDLRPGSCRALEHGRCKEHPSVYKQLSRAGSDPPKGSGPGIVPFPGCCWEIQLGAGCSRSCRVIQSAGKGLNSVPGLTTHLL